MSLELNGVHKRYGRSSVLDSVSFRVEPGEFVGLLGPNGSGKTTTLRIAAGFIAPTRGTVRIAGQALVGTSRALRGKIGYLPERPPLYDALSVADYLAFVARAKQQDDPVRAIAAVVEACKLGEVRKQRIGRLSKGFRQRVGLAQALLGDPEVLLLDEATSGLDPFQIREARLAISRGGGMRATLFSTHIMQEATALCSRLLLLRQGKIVSEHHLGDAASPAHWRVRLRGQVVSEAADALRALPEVDSVCVRETGDGYLILDCSGAPEAMAARVTRDWDLLELSPQQESLEDRLVRSFEDETRAAEQP